MSSAICFSLDQSEILLSGNGLRTLRSKILEGIIENTKCWPSPTVLSLILRTFSLCFYPFPNDKFQTLPN